MDWVLILSVQWVFAGSAVPSSNTVTLINFTSEELCRAAVQAIKSELEAPLVTGGNLQTFNRVVCVRRN
jgi:hypothetical protein